MINNHKDRHSLSLDMLLREQAVLLKTCNELLDHIRSIFVFLEGEARSLAPSNLELNHIPDNR